jgi:hypothetical protein
MAIVSSGFISPNEQTSAGLAQIHSQEVRARSREFHAHDLNICVFGEENVKLRGRQVFAGFA